jgi:saccharopine dehydrogenase-like NADP-dependent oxidoreductase
VNLFIFGAGQIGQAACKYAKDLGYEVTVLDTSEENLKKCNTHSKTHLQKDWQNTTDFYDSQNIAVISCLPYFCNTQLASVCIRRQVPYFDLGGVLSVTQAIDKLNADNRYKSIVFQNLGLSPGLSEILAEKMYYDNPGADTVNIYVGGIPEWPLHDGVNYKLTWSVEGLINNYKDDCEILEGGKIVTIKGMSKYTQKRLFDGLYEAFVTSGGAPNALTLMQRHGVKNSTYRTIRWPGHYNELDLALHPNDFPSYWSKNAKSAETLLKESSELHKDVLDMVLIHIEMLGKNTEVKRSWKISAKDGFTAMQRSTAIGLMAVVDAALRTINPRHGFSGNEIQFAATCPKFWENLDKLKLFT